ETVRGQVQGYLKRLPLDKAEYVRYRPLLEKHRREIMRLIETSRADEMHKVGRGIEDMLNDKGEKPLEKGNVSLGEFWARPDREVKDRRDDLEEFRTKALYGSPLVLTRKYGKGNVVAFLTTAGTKWSGWSGGEKSGVCSFTFPM